MIVIALQIICLVEALGLVLAIRSLSHLRRELAEARDKIRALRDQNAKLYMAIDEAHESAEIARAWYKRLFENTTDMVLVHSIAEGREPGPFVEANEVACKTLGYAREEFLNKTRRDIEEAVVAGSSWESGDEGGSLSEKYLDKWMNKAASDSTRRSIEQTLNEGEVTLDRVFKTKFGDKIPVEIFARRMDHNGKQFIVMTARDATSRRDNDEARKESESKLQTFFERSPFGIAVYNGERKLVQSNKACLEMLGFPDEEQLERFNLFSNPYVPADVKPRLIRGQTVQYEAAVDFDEAVRKSLCITSRKGMGWFVVVMSNMGRERGRIKGYFAEVKDITYQRRLEADLRRLSDVTTSAKSGISGSLSDITLTDLMQILCAGGRNMRVEISGSETSAAVTIESGNIVYCKAGESVGEEAFYDLMRWQTGDFEASECSECDGRNVAAPLMSLLMEGARRADEASE